MRRKLSIKAYLIFMLSLLLAASLQASSAVAKLLAKASTSPYTLLSGIPVDTTIANTSDTDLRVVETNDYRDYQMTLVDGAATPVPLTHLGKDMRNESYVIDRNASYTLKPGDHFSRRLELAKVFDIRQPGAYSLVVRRKIYQARSGTEITITSKRVTLSVGP